MNLQPRSGDTTLATGVRACSPKDEIVKPLLFPSSRGGVAARSKKVAKLPLTRRRGGQSFLTTPSAPSVASHCFLDAQPPLLCEGGNSSIRAVSFHLGKTSVRLWNRSAAVSALFLIFVVIGIAVPAEAQRGQPAGPPPTAKSAAPIDLTGYWTAVITEDWHTRMLTAPRGDFGTGAAGAVALPGETPIGTGPNPAAQGSIPYKPKGAQAAMAWDPSKDEAEGNQCKAYGAPGVMRGPTHLHITWLDDNTLKIEADYGMQTRLMHFPPPPHGGQMNFVAGIYVPPEVPTIAPPNGTEPGWQGYSIAAWWTNLGGRGNFERGGSLKVTTTHLKPGYYWKNGMPYSGGAIMTEHFRVHKELDNSERIVFSQMIEDPQYLTQPYIVTYHFKNFPTARA